MSSPDLRTLSGRLARARVTAGSRVGRIISKKALAAAAGVAGSSYDKYEKGESEPTIRALAAMASVLLVNPSWLAWGYGQMEADIPLIPSGETADQTLDRLDAAKVEGTSPPEEGIEQKRDHG